MKQPSSQHLGIILALTAAVFWGGSGACAQFLFQARQIDVAWLVTVRLLLAGALLLAYAGLGNRRAVWRIWSSGRSSADLLLFSLLGMVTVQYTYFAAIRHSNAATGTVLQYLGPVFIAIYYALRNRRAPSAAEGLAILLAFLGTLLLATHGDPGGMQLSGLALSWGIASALALAFYTIKPVRLLQGNHPAVVVGWAMLIGGAALGMQGKPWRLPGTWDWQTLLATGFVVLFGTVAAFSFYLAAVKRIGPQKTSLLACAEPLSAALVAVLWLGVPFGPADWAGAACIVATVFILGRK